MKRYIRSSDDADFGYGYGFDSNGDAIDESTVEALLGIAENEILPKSELNQKFYGCSIDEDSFEYHMSGTAWGAYLSYTIYVPANSDEIDVNNFLRKGYDGMSIARFDQSTRVELDFYIHVNGDDIRVERGDCSVYDASAFNTYMSQLYDENLNWKALCDYVGQYAESAVSDIHAALSNI